MSISNYFTPYIERLTKYYQTTDIKRTSSQIPYWYDEVIKPLSNEMARRTKLFAVLRSPTGLACHCSIGLYSREVPDIYVNERPTHWLIIEPGTLSEGILYYRTG